MTSLNPSTATRALARTSISLVLNGLILGLKVACAFAVGCTKWKKNHLIQAWRWMKTSILIQKWEKTSSQQFCTSHIERKKLNYVGRVGQLRGRFPKYKAVLWKFGINRISRQKNIQNILLRQKNVKRMVIVHKKRETLSLSLDGTLGKRWTALMVL